MSPRHAKERSPRPWWSAWSDSLILGLITTVVVFVVLMVIAR